MSRQYSVLSWLYTVLSFVAAINTYLLVPWPWYFALLAALGIFNAMTLARIIYENWPSILRNVRILRIARKLTRATAGSPTERLITLRDAIKQIGWFPATYSAVVGGPSTLAIVQAVFKGWRLTPAFQWIVDGYSRITAQLASYVEPFIVPPIAWINSLFDWHLVLYPHWRPTFLLISMFSVAPARALWSVGKRLFATGMILSFAPPALAVSLLFGLIAHPFGLYLVLSLVLLGTLAMCFFGLGFAELVLGFSPGPLPWYDADPRIMPRHALNLLGAFVTAAMIVGADQMLKWLGS